MPEADADLALLESATRAGGAIARRYYGGPYRKWDKSPGNPVTEADLAVDDCLRTQLTAARPSYAWLSEESRDDPARLSADTVFIVDPIDGTTAFMKGRPHFTVCAATVRAGQVMAGAVYNPITDEMFTARRGGGAARNGAPIHVSGADRVEGCALLADRQLLGRPFWREPPLRPWPSDMTIESRGSVAYRLALVAMGAFDAALILSAKREWDVAAASLLAMEAGGIVTAHDGAALAYNRPGAVLPSVVAAPPALHAALLARVSSLHLSG